MEYLLTYYLFCYFFERKKPSFKEAGEYPPNKRIHTEWCRNSAHPYHRKSHHTVTNHVKIWQNMSNYTKHSVTNMKFWYERISEYIRIEKNNTNECPNIFVSKKGYEYDTNEYSWRKVFEYIRISEYSRHYDMKNMIRTNIQIYSDQKMIRTNIRIYSYQKKDTNMIWTNIRGRKYSNIFEYPIIRHTMIRFCHQCYYAVVFQIRSPYPLDLEVPFLNLNDRLQE